MESSLKNEKRIKGYLKNRISLDSSVVVRFLITGGIALSLTACGGGSSSGSNSPNNGDVSQPINPVEKVKIDQVDKGVSLTGKTAEVDGKISGTKNDLVGITAKNSNVKSNANIELNGENSVGIYATADQKQRAIFTVENNGNIKMSGKNAVGILADNGVVAKNNGNITMNSVKEKGENVIETGEYYAYIQKEIVFDSVGMLGKGDGTQVINDKNIDLNGSGVGVLVKDGAKGENNGIINVTSQTVDAVGYAKGSYEDGEVDWKYQELGKMYSKISGMGASGNATAENTKTGKIYLKGAGAGMEAAENSNAVNNGKIIAEALKEVWYETTNIGEPDSYENPSYDYTKTTGMFAEKGSEIVNNNSIYVKNSGIGMFAEKNSKLVNNGNIVVEGVKSESTGFSENAGLCLFENSTGENNGAITVSGETENEGVVLDETSNFVNNGEIKVSSLNCHATGISGNGTIGGSKIVNNGKIEINYKNTLNEYGESIGISARRDILNEGIIKITSEGGIQNIGIRSNVNNPENFNYKIINSKNGEILLNGENVVGIQVNTRESSEEKKDNISIINDGLILVSGKTRNPKEDSMMPTGIQSFNYAGEKNKGLITNNGKIEINSLDIARGIDSYANDVINNGVINVNGIDSEGIRVQAGNAIAINNGIINADGKGSFGMYAGPEGTAINAENGIINVLSSAEGGMIASGENSKVINKGTINIAARDGVTEENKESIAVVAKNGGTIENTGIVNIDGDLKIGTSGSYTIGTTKDGKYGKISAKNIDIQGNLKVSTEIVKGGYKSEYKLDNVIESENSIENNIGLLSDSLLYNTKLEKDSEGNYDAKLERNEKRLEEFAKDEVKSTGNILSKYFEEKNFAMLSSDAKEVLNRIDTSNISGLNRDLKEITPNIYSNIGRELQSTTELFATQDQNAIESIGKNNFNFIFLGEHNKVDNRGAIEGYKSNVSGFIGAVDLGKGFYGTLGYGYNDLDYKDNGKGNIETIHLGVNKIGTFAELEYKFGVGGEYSFHNTKRDVFDRRAESDFNSYAIRGFAEVTKQYGKDLYIKPYLGLSLAYMGNESFSESGAGALNARIDSEDYTSIQPKLGFKIGKNLGNLNLFTVAEYSYELGDMDKNQTFSLEGFEGKGELEKDNLEKGRGKIKAGVGYDIGSLNISGAVGKEFGIDEDNFVELSIGYRF